MEPMIGEIKLFTGNFAPVGFLFCQGQELPIPQYQPLFSLIGFNYGGSGGVFNLPNLPSLPVTGGPAINYIIAVNGDYPMHP